MRFMTAEHYMMYEKARLFEDGEAAGRILLASSPGEAKAIGREVESFCEETWVNRRFDIVVEANTHKFTSHGDLREFLIGTGERVLVEASPVDRIWGIGLAEDDDAAENPRRWRGTNLLGFALMEVRKRLIA